MEIRCGNSEKISLLIVSICFCICMYFSEIFLALSSSIIFLMHIPRYLYCFRHFRLDETGVEITYLGLFQRYYPWDCFVVKQMVRPLNNPGFDMYGPGKWAKRTRHSNPVLLSYKPILFPSCINYGYAFWHPLSCVFIGFDDEFPKSKYEWINKEERSERDFEVNREEFISKMNEWGVEIKGLNDQQ